MDNKEILIEIMEKTISSLQTNKESVVSLIKNMQTEYERKKQELKEIKEQIPKFFNHVKKLSQKDTEIRQKLASASSDFSNIGHEHLKKIYEEANAIHSDLQKAEEDELSLIKRRNTLELDLKRSAFYIDQADHMAQQILVSLSYLQSGVAHLNESTEENPVSSPNAAAIPYMSFLKSIENEKFRIARDLHDGPAQQIASAQMRVDFCKTIIKQDLDAGLKILDQLKSDLSLSLTEVRSILFHLTPAPLEKMGLKGSVENLINTTLDLDKTKMSFYYELNDTTISSALETTIYRIVQELISNIQKHASATQVMLRISASNDHIYIHLIDNGIGLKVPADFKEFKTGKKSFGLSNVEARVSELDGILKINSDEHKGTIFNIQLPR